MLELVKLDLKEVKEVKAIYKEAFPLVERKPFITIKNGVKKKKLELMALKDDGKIVGFGTCFPYKDMMYLDYLAMDKSYRDKGYGSEYLKRIQQYYQDKRICLILERVDKPSENHQQRVKRKQFYLRNGMNETHLFCDAKSGNYEILVHGGEISGDEFIEIINYSLGWLFKKLANYHIVN